MSVGCDSALRLARTHGAYTRLRGLRRHQAALSEGRRPRAIEVARQPAAVPLSCPRRRPGPEPPGPGRGQVRHDARPRWQPEALACIYLVSQVRHATIDARIFRITWCYLHGPPSHSCLHDAGQGGHLPHHPPSPTSPLCTAHRLLQSRPTAPALAPPPDPVSI